MSTLEPTQNAESLHMLTMSWVIWLLLEDGEVSVLNLFFLCKVLGPILSTIKRKKSLKPCLSIAHTLGADSHEPSQEHESG